MKDNFERVFRTQQFQPGFFAVFLNPFYFARIGLYRAIKSLSKQVNGRILDVGCGKKPYENLFDCEEYIGLEYDTPANRENKLADFFYDGKEFPFESEQFDSVVCNQVLEHVFNPDEFLLEICRVVKGGGVILLTVPFVWDEHEQPIDYARYSSFGLASLLEKNGFEVLVSLKTSNDITVVVQLFNAYLYKKIRSKNKYVNVITTFLFIAPINLIGVLLSFVFPKNNDLYLDNVILAKKK